MGWFRPSRERTGPDRYLRWKQALFLVGAVLALVGMARNDARLIYAAVAALLLGFGLRFLPR